MRSQNSSRNFGSEVVVVVVEHNPCREDLTKIQLIMNLAPLRSGANPEWSKIISPTVQSHIRREKSDTHCIQLCHSLLVVGIGSAASKETKVNRYLRCLE
ncbi:hypothetical protein SCA6_003929 [Theobroma cacao]